MSPELSSPKKDPFAVLRIKEFRLFITGRLFLTLAVQMQSIVVGWQIYEHTKSAFALGMIGLAEAIPFICTALFGGHVADIINRKKIIMLAISAFIAGTFALFYFTLSFSTVLHSYGVFPIYLVIFMTGIARAFLGPSFFAFLSQLIPRELYPNAASWNSIVWQTGAVAGPALGGLLYGFIGVTKSYGTEIVLLLIAISVLSFIKAKPIPPKDKKESLFESLGTGIRFVFNNQVILGALSLDLFAVFFGGAVALLPVFADKILHVGPEGLGILRAAPAVGAVIMALFLTYRPPVKKAGGAFLWAVAGFGLCMISFAISKNFYLSFALLALSGAFDNVSVVVRSTTLQLMTPDNMRGRVSSVNSIFIGSSNEIGEFESGVAAKLMRLVPSVIFGGFMTLAVTGITAKLAPKLRLLNLDDHK